MPFRPTPPPALTLFQRSLEFIERVAPVAPTHPDLFSLVEHDPDGRIYIGFKSATNPPFDFHNATIGDRLGADTARLFDVSTIDDHIKLSLLTQKDGEQHPPYKLSNPPYNQNLALIHDGWPTIVHIGVEEDVDTEMAHQLAASGEGLLLSDNGAQAILNEYGRIMLAIANSPQ